jgi:predicted RNA-binding Zn-ribbon protein involved in translation (DUF1610 family)
MVKQVRRKKDKPKHRERDTKFCPKCGSEEVFWAQGLPQLWSLWQCNTCGYHGPVILEDGEMADVLQKKYRRQDSPKS